MSDDEKARAEAERRTDEYFPLHATDGREGAYATTYRDGFKDGAAWQREQDAAEIERLRDKGRVYERAVDDLTLEMGDMIDRVETHDRAADRWMRRALDYEATIERVRTEAGEWAEAVPNDVLRAILDAR